MEFLTQDEMANILRYPILSVTVYIPTYAQFDLIFRLYTSIIISCNIVNHMFMFLRICFNIHNLNTLGYSMLYAKYFMILTGVCRGGI